MGMKIFRDPVYDYISCSKEELDIIDSKWFQRLRHCSQNSTSRLVYPTLLGTRFEHSMGVMHLAGKMVLSAFDPLKFKGREALFTSFISKCKKDFREYLCEYSLRDDACDQEIIDFIVRIVRIAGLLHDIGHFPLSHTVETVFDDQFCQFPIDVTGFKGDDFCMIGLGFHVKPQRACHEMISAEIIRQLTIKGLISKTIGHAAILLLLCPWYHGFEPQKTVFHTLHRLIVSAYDADRLDYLQRDSHFGMGNLGLIDIDRFIYSLYLAQNSKASDVYHIIPTSKAVSTIETIFMERYKEKKWIHFHHKTMFYDLLAQKIALPILKKNFKCFLKEISPNDMPVEFTQAISGINTIRGQLVRQEPIQETTIPSPVHASQIISKYLWNSTKSLQFPFIVNYDLENKKCYCIDADELVEQRIDDIWFSCKCREYIAEDCIEFEEELRVISRILVYRDKNGISLWKNTKQFDVFWDMLFRINSFADKLGELRNSPHADKVALPETVRKSIIDKKISLSKLILYPLSPNYRCYIAAIPWNNLFFDSSHTHSSYGDSSKFLYEEHFPSPSMLEDHSTLIKDLDGLRGEIPFYLYMVKISEREDAKFIDIEEEKKHLATQLSSYILKCEEERLFIQGQRI